jgi:hypothetical protein
MKFLLLFLVFVPVALHAQECNIKKEKDQFSQQERLTTGFMQLTNSRLSVTADSKELDFFITVAPDKCFDDASTISIVFEDGRTKSNFRNSGSMNCEGLFHFTIRNTPTSNSHLQRLEVKKIKSMMLTNGKVATSILLNETQQQLLQNAITCLSKEAKTLIAKP